jgi:hypothetical protein
VDAESAFKNVFLAFALLLDSVDIVLDLPGASVLADAEIALSSKVVLARSARLEKVVLHLFYAVLVFIFL